jgi:sugar/nucleoside kinase (ribokinase family)
MNKEEFPIIMYKKLNQYDQTLSAYKSIQDKLYSQFSERLTKKKVFLALDGFIDSLYSLIKTRYSITNWKQFSTIKEFSERLDKISGSSGNIEMILKKKTSGGFVPNNAKALSALGIEVFLLASLGYPDINPIYESLFTQENVNAFSIANPGRTIGLEFNDGKIMLSDFKSLLEKRKATEILMKQIRSSDIIGFGYWSVIPQLTNIWQQLIEKIFPSINNLKKKIFFVDLADIKKRSTSEIEGVLKCIQEIETYIPVLLSLNDQEAIDVSKAIANVKEINPDKPDDQSFFAGGKQINQELNLSYLIIHSPHFATISLKNDAKQYWITECYTSKPSYTTSAGDHFNSGVITGLLGGLTPSESLLMGNALAAIFVRAGISPHFSDLREFINRYMEYLEHDNPQFP